MKIKDNVGSTIEPWGTPVLIQKHLEDRLSIILLRQIVNCRLSINQDIL